ncbi:hypothetical protein [Hominenteromicrobium sp.]|uniref:hypothetical protein n=1 Tax=Hominenteromicrobium sp. TaxID=3073581 RepID=UPI003AF19FC2
MYEKELAAYFKAHKDEFLEDLAVLVAIPSVKTEPSGDCPYAGILQKPCPKAFLSQKNTICIQKTGKTTLASSKLNQADACWTS